MATRDTYQFRFVVTDVALNDKDVERIENAIAQAATLALAPDTPEDALTYRVGPGWWWRGIPPVTVREILAEVVAEKTDSLGVGD
jgi:hypothetical protein